MKTLDRAFGFGKRRTTLLAGACGMPTSTYRTRFAPSPTGVMHLGHARTHLVTWLRARSQGGAIVLRFDDLDTARVREGSIEDFLAVHAWLGLDFDEGPYFQSARLARYEAALLELQRGGRVYACACSRSQIEALRPPPAGDGGLCYPGTCRDAGLPWAPGRAIRFRWDGVSPGFQDAVFDKVVPGAVVGDFVVRRADGVFAYHLASVVDDVDFGIQEVVRGEDLLLATQRQLLLFEALGASPPAWFHVPLVMGRGGEKLAKSAGSPGVLALRDDGVTAEQLLGHLAHSLGLTATPKAITLQALLEVFQVATIRDAATEIALPTLHQS